MRQANNGDPRTRSTNILSVDVEDYFMVEAFAGSIARDTWDHWPPRVVDSVGRVLDLFDKYQAHATFFFVGWIADKFPELVRQVASRGHELASHSYWHRTVYSLSSQEFREDTRRSISAIQQAAGVKVFGYRAPSWSITNKCRWALDVLEEEGFTYDSSIYPIHHDLYGIPGARRFPYEHRCSNGKSLQEFPPATVRILGQNFPAAGGGYLRIFPMAYTRWAFRKYENTYGQPVVLYLHPWEIDPNQPRIASGWRSRVRHYTNLTVMYDRLEWILKAYAFKPFSHFSNSSKSTCESPVGQEPAYVK